VYSTCLKQFKDPFEDGIILKSSKKIPPATKNLFGNVNN
jgi:hypothetical protein